MGTHRFTISSPSQSENAFQYQIGVSNLNLNSHLTYELFPNEVRVRNLLLIPETSGFRSHLSNEEKAGLDRLREELEITSNKPSVFKVVKNIVNRIQEGSLTIPNVRLAVHHMGPVPVYVLPEAYEINYNSQILVKVALYPKLQRSSYDQHNEEAVMPAFLWGNKAEFVRSLSHGLGTMFTRYLEDIGEDMFDIANHLNLVEVFGRCKELETTVARSIQAKIAALYPSPKNASKSPEDNLIRETYDANADWIFTAAYARQYALHLLNLLYGQIGLARRDFLEDFQKLRGRFDSFSGYGWYDSARQRIAEVSMLSSALRRLEGKESGKISDLKSSRPWTNRFLEFAHFIETLRECSYPAPCACVFVSSHHDVPVSETVKARISDLIEREFRGHVNLT